MFWINSYHAAPAIESAWMTGFADARVIDTEMIEPQGLAVDMHMDGRIFWSDFKKGMIESCKPDGSGRIKIFTKGASLSGLELL